MACSNTPNLVESKLWKRVAENLMQAATNPGGFNVRGELARVFRTKYTITSIENSLKRLAEEQEIDITHYKIVESHDIQDSFWLKIETTVEAFYLNQAKTSFDSLTHKIESDVTFDPASQSLIEFVQKTKTHQYLGDFLDYQLVQIDSRYKLAEPEVSPETDFPHKYSTSAVLVETGEVVPIPKYHTNQDELVVLMRTLRVDRSQNDCIEEAADFYWKIVDKVCGGGSPIQQIDECAALLVLERALAFRVNFLS